MTPPLLLQRYRHSELAEEFSTEITRRYSLEEVGVRILSSRLADLDHDGEADDLAGTALLQVGSRFKSFIFLTREDGATQFLENNGGNLVPTADLRTLSCMESRPWLCPATLDRAERQIHGARISLVEFDETRPGLELVIQLGDGLRTILNAQEVFAAPPGL